MRFRVSDWRWARKKGLQGKALCRLSFPNISVVHFPVTNWLFALLKTENRPRAICHLLKLTNNPLSTGNLILVPVPQRRNRCSLLSRYEPLRQNRRLWEDLQFAGRNCIRQHLSKPKQHKPNLLPAGHSPTAFQRSQKSHKNAWGYTCTLKILLTATQFVHCTNT